MAVKSRTSLALVLVLALAAAGLPPAAGGCADRAGGHAGASPPQDGRDARAPAPTGIAPLVAVDAGHGPLAPGAIGARGTRERDVNVAVARRLVAALEREGLRAILLDAGAALGNAARAAEAGRLGAAALVSIHHDAVQPRYLEAWTVGGVARAYSDRFRGFSVFASGAGARPDESLALARAIGAALRGLGLAPTLHHAEPIPGEGRELVDAPLGVYRYDELAILRHAPMPAVLVECGVLVNREEERALLTAERQEAVAGAVARAIAGWAARTRR